MLELSQLDLDEVATALSDQGDYDHQWLIDPQSEPIPEPLSSRTNSCKFDLRIGDRLHRELAIKAAEEHLSLNQYVVRKLGDAS